MNPRLVPPLTVAVACLMTMAACQTPSASAPRTDRAELEQQLAESRELVRRYERRYGKLLPARPAHDFRKLRADLKGQPASAVVARLGKPGRVYSTGSSDSWDYANIAYDPVSGRTVRNLEIWFRNGMVEYMKASF